MEKKTLQSLNQISPSSLQGLSQKRIYFAHQSVGDDILNGIATLMHSHKALSLALVQTANPADLSRPIFAHSAVGSNGNTESKITAFNDIVEKGMGKKADIAFLKFCFWDIRQHTDINQVFRSYKKTLAQLQTKYPNVVFVHMTVPLMSYRNGWKDRVNRILGRERGADNDNVKRNELNELLLEAYAGKEPIFDIAAVESTLPDGARTSFSMNGKQYYHLASDYTYDGGHLNDKGKNVVAEQLIIFLAGLQRKH